MRTFDTSLITKATQQYSKEIVGLNVEEWVKNELNIALTNDNGDVAMFESQPFFPDIVFGHYFFFSRGKDAVKASHKFLKELFINYYPIGIIGFTPEEHKGALWLNRHLGFKDHGRVDTIIGPCRFVVMTKDMWKEKYK